MKLIFSGLVLFFVLFAQSVSRATSESLFKVKNQDLNLSNRQAERDEDAQGMIQNFTGQLGEDGDETRYEKSKNLAYSVKAKGKGAFGGANVVHRPRDSKNIALGPVKPSLFATIITACVTLGWSLGYTI